MEAVAKLSNIKTSPRKARLVADIVRGKDVYQALSILKYNPKASSALIEKVLESAISNWANKNEGMRPEDSDLFIKSITIDGGPMLKRFRPAPFGRAYRIRKRTSHITIVVDSRNELAKEMEEISNNVQSNIEE